MKKYRVLLVDDNAQLIKLLNTFLTGEGFEVATAGNGKQALESVSLSKPDLLILDVSLPDTDGFTVLNTINQTQKIPCIMLSGVKREITHKVLGFDAGADDYITKPVSLDVLLQRIQAVLRRYYSQE